MLSTPNALQVRTPQRERAADYRRAGESRYVHRTRVTALAVPAEEPFQVRPKLFSAPGSLYRALPCPHLSR